MRDLIALALWIAVGFGLTALAAIELERSQVAKQQAAAHQSYDPTHDIRDTRASDTTTP